MRNRVIRDDIRWLIQHTQWGNFRSKRILITGASGSIARFLVFYFMMLNEDKQINCEVYALARNKEKAETVFVDYLENPLFHLLIGSVEEQTDCTDGMNYVFHGAGISQTDLFGIYPVEVLRANIIGSYNLLDRIASQEHSNIDKFVFFSSGAVYGELPDSSMDTDEDTYFGIDMLSNAGVYAEGKRAGELLCYSYWKEYQIPVTMARIGHAYGPGIDIDDGHVYSDFVKSIIDGQPLLIRNPVVERPFTYVRDTVYGLLILALFAPDCNAYNLWNVEGMVSIGKLADILTGRVFSDRNLKMYCNDKLYVYSQTDDSGRHRRRTDTQKLEKLGWRACVNIEEGFYRTVKSLEEDGNKIVK